jgi:proteasome assembly chaperone (PAC2) family protein
MQGSTWIKHHKKLVLDEPIALAGSPGLRSIGKLVIDSLIDALKPQLIATLYSTHLPLIYQTKPAYTSHPMLPGIGGVKVDVSGMDLPNVQFFASTNPPLIITSGTHANFNGQYEVAEKVLDFYEEVGVKRLIVLAGYGMEGEEVSCAATNRDILTEMKERYDVPVCYKGPFYGFSGLVFGLASLREMESLCLLGRTEPKPEDPEYPDEEASLVLLNKLNQILGLKINWSK